MNTIRGAWILVVLLVLAALLASLLMPPRQAGVAGRTIALVQLTEVDRNTVDGFQAGMAALGYREGDSVTYLGGEPAGSIDRLEGIILDHLKQQPDLIFVSSTPATLAVKRLTEASRQPPVVFAPVNDPLGAGIVADLRHPGGHITGVRLPTGDDLRLQWLLRIAPRTKRVYLPYTPDDKSAQTSLRQAADAAARLGVTVLARPVNAADGIQAAIAALPADADAIFLPRDSRIEAGIAQFVALAQARRLPLSAPSRIQVEAGALFSYGFVHRDIGRQAARLADQIFKGSRAGDLPVEMAENSLAINLATATAIGIAIPDDILLQAEHVVR